MLAHLGGIEKYIKSGDKVLLKPNLVMGSSPEKAVNTNGEVVRAVAELCLEQGADLYLGDSPGMGTTKSVCGKCGITEALDGLDVKFIDFTPTDNMENKGKDTLGLDGIAKELELFDKVINLPKFKTHCMATLTLAIKNCFGMIVGPRKFQWHYRAGKNGMLFSKMLLNVFRKTSPVLNIIDAVTAMEGDGPTSGTPIHLGFLAASSDGLALDNVCSQIVGIDINNFPILKMANEDPDEKRKDWVSPTIKGVSVDKVKPDSFKLPRSVKYDNMVFPFLSGVVRKLVTSWTSPLTDKCTGCSRCANICPAEAIKMKEKLPNIDTKKCIRCYCCHELCPEGAMEIKKTFFSRMIEKCNKNG
jgi:uncharacterized protein (DUF362 family)/Pyruvate/2-oxoacid:ferredoxin oxidoreductase delta subunit